MHRIRKLLLGWCCAGALLASRSVGAEGTQPVPVRPAPRPSPLAETRPGTSADATKADAKLEPRQIEARQVEARQGPKAAVAPPLSAEDAALVRELALLEKVDLLKHLELFERDEAAGTPRPQRQQ